MTPDLVFLELGVIQSVTENGTTDRSYTNSYSSSIVTIVMFCVVSKINPDTGLKLHVFVPLLHNNLPLWGKWLRIFLRCFLHNCARSLA